VLLTLQYAHREQFRFEGLSRCIELAREALEGTGFAQGRVFFSAACGPSFAELGRIQEARRVLSEGLALAREMTGPGSTLGAVVALPWAALRYACNEIEPAGELLEEYFRHEPTVGTVDQLVAGWLTRSRLAQLRGDFAGAVAGLQEAHEFAERHSVQKLRLMVVAECVKLLLRMGCPDDAAVYARRRGLARATDQTLLRGSANSADSAQAQLAAVGAVHSTLEWDLIVAELCTLSGEPRAAQRAVAQAVRRAAPAGFSRAFLDAGNPILSLIERLADCEPQTQDPTDCFVRELLQAGQRSTECKAGAADAEWLLNSAVAGRLTTRELEILKLAGGGMLNKRISERLGLTEGTVKWYLQQVFDKLGVRERGRAAAKARQLGLIS
jgi:LuxR family maltose regulon positive regulatory protein